MLTISIACFSPDGSTTVIKLYLYSFPARCVKINKGKHGWWVLFITASSFHWSQVMALPFWQELDIRMRDLNCTKRIGIAITAYCYTQSSNFHASPLRSFEKLVKIFKDGLQYFLFKMFPREGSYSEVIFTLYETYTYELHCSKSQSKN